MLALLTTGATASVPQEGARNPYLYREQETALFGMGHSPSSAIQDQIGSKSTKGIHFLHRAGLSASSPRVWSSGTVTAIETYPAPAKTVKDLFDTSERLLDTYLETGQLPWVEAQRKDTVDAIVCALVARMHCVCPNQLVAPPGGDGTEDWIWLPRGVGPSRRKR